MKRFQGLIDRTKSLSKSNNRSQRSSFDFENAPVDSPEANAPKAVRLFCDSGSASNGGEEVLHLPVIVEAAESSPSAAAGAASQIKKFLSKEYQNRPSVQYNAIMLIRILADNPGATFTRNFDKSFVSNIKDTLRTCKDHGTQQILRETLDALEVDKQHDQGLQELLTMWKKEKGHGAALGNRTGYSARSPHTIVDLSAWQQPPQQPAFAAGWSGTDRRAGGVPVKGGLPAPAELASRVEEAKNTAKILLQLVQSTPTEEVINHELIREFSERCQGAQRSMQTYINCDNPPPDHDTMQTLIETNEQLSLALSRYQRAMLAARRAMGVSESPNPPAGAAQNGNSAFAPPPTTQNGNGVHSQGPTHDGEQQKPLAGPVNGFGTAIAQEPQHNGQTYGGYQGQSRQPQGDYNKQTDSPSRHHLHPVNPFADPDTGSPDLYGSGTGEFSNRQTVDQAQPTSQHHTYNTQSERDFNPAPVRRQNTADLENAYSDSEVSPVTNPSWSSSAANNKNLAPTNVVSPESAHPRPGPGPWHHSDVTPSYMGRQASALNGITMHGAQSNDDVQESGRPGAGPASGISYLVSPIDTRTVEHHNRGF